MRPGVWHGMPHLLFGLGVPCALLVAALLPAALADDRTPPRYEEHAHRLKTAASHSSDIRPGSARVRELQPLAGAESPDAVEGRVRWVGPFGMPMVDVRVTERTTDSQVYLWRIALAWGGLAAGTLVPPALVVWRNTRT